MEVMTYEWCCHTASSRHNLIVSKVRAPAPRWPRRNAVRMGCARDTQVPVRHPHKLHSDGLISNSQGACTYHVNSTNELLAQEIWGVEKMKNPKDRPASKALIFPVGHLRIPYRFDHFPYNIYPSVGAIVPKARNTIFLLFDAKKKKKNSSSGCICRAARL